MQMRLDDACGYLWVSFRQGHESIRSANRSLRPTAAVRNATTRSKSVIFSFGHRVSFFGAPPEARPSCFSSSFSFYFWGVQSIERENEKAFPYFPFFFFFLAQADPFFFWEGGAAILGQPVHLFSFFFAADGRLGRYSSKPSFVNVNESSAAENNKQANKKTLKKKVIDLQPSDNAAHPVHVRFEMKKTKQNKNKKRVFCGLRRRVFAGVVTRFRRRFLGFHEVSPCLMAFYRILLGFTGFYLVLLGFTGFYLVLLGFTGFYLVLPSFTGFHLVLLGFIGFYWV